MFPFDLKDLAYFIIRRKDGMTIRYNLTHGANDLPSTPGNTLQTVLDRRPAAGKTTSFGDWCQHVPAEDPLFTSPNLDLYIADAAGFRAHYKEFDFALDCGHVLTEFQVTSNSPNLFLGDMELLLKLAPYATGESTLDPRVLQIDWDDRKAPRLRYDFWPNIVKELSGTVLICCQGGHGRSGTGAVCMMMALNPEYSPADAIIHLRAVHCARAIESKEQHDYIGKVGEFLGRPNDIERIGSINSYKDEFFKLTHKSAKLYQDRLRAMIEAGKSTKEDKKAYAWEAV